jgi:hypothetical protein
MRHDHLFKSHGTAGEFKHRRHVLDGHAIRRHLRNARARN